MPEIPLPFFFNSFIYLAIPFVFAYIASRIRIPAVVGYMIGGVVLGNIFSHLISRELITSFAYFGIILLLFAVGLEVNFKRMMSMKKFIIIGGVLQILLTVVYIFFLSVLFGFDVIQSFLVGIALSSSSTTLVVKIIQDRGEEGSFLGEVAIGVLMFQDLAFIPFVIIFNSITTRSAGVFELFRNIFVDVGIAMVILWGMVVIGQRAIPVIFTRVSRASRELLNFFIVIFIFAVAYVSIVFKVPILVGVFVAGVLISQTTEHHHIFTRIRPIRDLLAIVFFIFIGTNIEISSILPNIGHILSYSLFVILGKALIIMGVFLFLKFSTRLSFYTSAYLFQIDEDAFILMSIALANNIFSRDQYLFVISSTLLSLIATPFLMNNKDRIYLGVRGFIRENIPVLDQFLRHRVDVSISPIDEINLKNHVIIAGYGRVGSRVGKALTLANIPFIAIDYNSHMVERAKQGGVNIIYGDPTDPDILDYVECEEASCLVSAVPAPSDQEAIVLNARRLNPDIYIISRVQTDRDQERMRNLGVQAVVQPELEAAVSIIKRIFVRNRMPKDEIIKSLRHLKLIHGAI